MQALDATFNRAILFLAPQLEARAIAPATLRDLHAAYDQTGKLIVWEGASDDTIYGDAAVNHAFRAWHDLGHLHTDNPFTLQGEQAECAHDLARLRLAFPGLPRRWETILRAEITGQAGYYAEHGFFPTDQSAFISNLLEANQWS